MSSAGTNLVRSILRSRTSISAMLAGRRGLAWAVLLVSLLAQVVCGAARPPYPRPARRLPPPSAPLASLLLSCARFASAGETAGPGEGSTERTSPHSLWVQCCGAATCFGLQPAHTPIRREARHVASVKQPGSSDLRVLDIAVQVAGECGAGASAATVHCHQRIAAVRVLFVCLAVDVCLCPSRRRAFKHIRHPVTCLSHGTGLAGPCPRLVAAPGWHAGLL